MFKLVALLEGARLLLASAILRPDAIAFGMDRELVPPAISLDVASTSVSRMVVLAAVGGWRGCRCSIGLTAFTFTFTLRPFALATLVPA